jgi:hypothetical protein
MLKSGLDGQFHGANSFPNLEPLLPAEILKVRLGVLARSDPLDFFFPRSRILLQLSHPISINPHTMAS